MYAVHFKHIDGGVPQRFTTCISFDTPFTDYSAAELYLRFKKAFGQPMFKVKGQTVELSDFDDKCLEIEFFLMSRPKIVFKLLKWKDKRVIYRSIWDA